MGTVKEKKRDQKKICHKFHNKWQLQLTNREQNKKTCFFKDNKVNNTKRHFQLIP